MGDLSVEMIARNMNCQITCGNIYWLLDSVKYITKFTRIIRGMLQNNAREECRIFDEWCS